MVFRKRTSLYLLRVLMMIMVMIPDKKKTTTTELTIENQWI